MNVNKEINHVSCELNASVGSLLKDALLLVPGKLHMDEFEARYMVSSQISDIIL